MWFPVEVEWMQRGRERGHWLPAVEDCSVETSHCTNDERYRCDEPRIRLHH